MGHYVSIRGWLEYPEEMKTEVKSMIDAYVSKFESYGMPKWRAELYNKGWCFPKDQVNWAAYLFYGADIREYHLEYIRDQLTAISGIYEEDVDDQTRFFTSGRFDVLDCENEREYVWILSEGSFNEEEIKR